MEDREKQCVEENRWTVLRGLKEEKRVTETLVRYHGMVELEGQ